MKKKGLIIASLLVLVMSFVFLGCPPPEDEEEELVTYNPTVPANVLKILKDNTGYEGLKIPANVNYEGYFLNDQNGGGSDYVAIWWKDADQDKFDAYKAQWTPAAGSVREQLVAKDSKDLTSICGKGTAKIVFTEGGGDQIVAVDKINFTVPANSIYFAIYKD